MEDDTHHHVVRVHTKDTTTDEDTHTHTRTYSPTHKHSEHAQREPTRTESETGCECRVCVCVWGGGGSHWNVMEPDMPMVLAAAVCGVLLKMAVGWTLRYMAAPDHVALVTDHDSVLVASVHVNVV